MRAKKSYGQHFLTNESYAQRIADALQLSDQYDQVLEVGPGKGMLTKYLLEKDFQLKVVEADPDMVVYLRNNYQQLSEQDIIAANFLRVALEEHFSGAFAIIGNYPYNISSQILIKTIDYRHAVPEMAGMFQKEVADRVVAGPGSKTYGVIGVLVQAFYEVEYLFTVGAGNFNPPPKVKSAVIRLVRRRQPLVDDELWRTFRQVVKLSFGQRRKMLRNSLKSLLPAEELQNATFQLRPEQIELEKFVEIAKLVEANRSVE
ncbi:MAG: 16S rRNA (adenine(1518)-N(6)/adenine(1519)-N(6))-dimethyltransferase RsmA [Bacteroidota bacterium]